MPCYLISKMPLVKRKIINLLQKSNIMKKHILLSAFLMCFGWLSAQQKTHNIVFDMTSSDTVDHKSVIRWVDEMSKSYPDIQLEVVFYGQSLGMIQKEKSIVSEQVTRLAQNKNVRFRVCEQAMKRQQVDKSQLLPGVQTVPDGIYEIIQREAEGWGYIKAAR